MPDETDLLEIEEQTLIVPGVLCVSPTTSGATKKRIRVGPSAGWMIPRGIMKWERELSFVRRSDVTPELLSALRGTLPHEQIAPKKYAMAARAAMASPLIPLASSLAAEARGQGVRVYTVGVDRVSAGFYYFAEGGTAEPIRAQGNLVEMLAPGLKENATNAEIEALLDGLIERLLLTFSEGSFTELDVELADALPRLARDGTGLQGTNLDAFDASARRLALQSAPWEELGRKLAESVAGAGSASGDTLRLPLYGSALRETWPALDVHFGGKTLRLAEQPMWMVTGQPKEEESPVAAPAAKPSEAPAAPIAVAAAPIAAAPVAAAPIAAAPVAAAPIAAPVAAAPIAVAPIAAVSTGTLTGVAAPVVAPGAAPRPAISPTAARFTPQAPAVATTPSPAVVAPLAAAVSPVEPQAPAKTEALEAPAVAPSPTPVAAESPVLASTAAEPSAPEAPAPATAAVAEPPADAAESSEPTTSEAIVPVGDERVVPAAAAQSQKALAKKGRPFPVSTLLLLLALAYFALRHFHLVK